MRLLKDLACWLFFTLLLAIAMWVALLWAVLELVTDGCEQE